VTPPFEAQYGRGARRCLVPGVARDVDDAALRPPQVRMAAAHTKKVPFN
jgi:hypothetical protein